MADRPLNLRDWQVRAALDGRLSALVVPLKPQPGPGQSAHVYSTAQVDWQVRGKFGRALSSERFPLIVGDRYWCRETWGTGVRPDPFEGWRDGVEYRADDIGLDERDILPLHPVDAPDGVDLDAYPHHWMSSAQMPRWASRITIIPTEVRACRLQEVTEDDARAMGSLGSHPAALVDYWVDRYGRGAWGRNPWCAIARVDTHHRNIDRMDAG